MWLFERIQKRAISLTAIALVVFHLYTGVFGLMPAAQQRGMHVLLALALVFAIYPARKSSSTRNRIPWWDLLLIVLVVVSAGNIFINWMDYEPYMTVPMTPFRLALAVICILLVMESGRRVIGWVFPALTALALAYTLCVSGSQGEA